MAAHNFKNMIKTTIFTDDSFQPLLKKSDQYRKTTQVALQHFQSIVKNFEQFQNSYEKILVEYEEYTEVNQISVPQYYQIYMQLYRNIWSEQKTFDQKLANSMKELTSLSDSLFTNYSNRILTFQGYTRSYKAHQQVLIELSKKYFRSHKTMITSIDSYKSTFTDAKIIYNMDQKHKRYSICANNHKTLEQELDNLDKKMNQLSEQKLQIIEAYKDIDREFVLTLKAIGGKLISISKSFVQDFCRMEKVFIGYLAEKKFALEKLELKTFFNAETSFKINEYFDVEIDPSKTEFYPAFVVYHANIKEDYYCQLGKLLMASVKSTDCKIENRKKLSKKMLEFTSNYIKLYQKGYYFGLKDIIANYQKIKKGLSQIFGPRLCSFLKSIHSIFELSIGINEKLIKRTLTKFKNIQLCLIEEIKTLDLFKRQFRINIDNFINSKCLKKVISQKQMNEFTEEEQSSSEVKAIKLFMAQKSQHLSILIDGFVEKFKKNYDELKFQYNTVVNDISVSTNEFYSLCCEYQEIYFGQDEFMKNYKKYETDIDAVLDKQRKYFQEINFGSLLREDTAKITFDPEFSKIEQYKKLKKPASTEVDLSASSPEVKRKSSAGEEEAKVAEPRKIEEGKGEKEENMSKHKQFIISKVTFLPEQKFFKSFSCALSDKILLSGRIYITNKRLCFHSKFNPDNLFFGETFLEIPRKDIKKIEKRINVVVFDNSISITTINGEVFFSSFFSRNEAFNIIYQALELDNDECMFEPEEIKEQAEEVEEILHEDDIKEEHLAERKENIGKMLSVWPYKDLFQAQFAYPKFNAFRFLKMFEVGEEFAFNRKTFPSFSLYIKDCLQHKESQYSEWTPSKPYDCLNSTNLKKETPLTFTRKITCLVPVANSGVPFMPKQAKSEETQVLYIYSKDKFIVESSIQNTGVPYCDTFNIKLLKVVESINENACKMTISLHVNFLSNTMMKSIIESKSFEETKNAMARVESEVKKYLNYLQKLKLRSKQSLGSDNQAAPSTSNNDEELTQLRQSEQTLKTQLSLSNSKFQQCKKILLGSLILNVLLMLLLIS